MNGRPVPTWLLVALSLAAGGAGGVLVGRHWAASAWRAEVRAAQSRLAGAAARARDPAAWRRDSAARTAAEARFARRPRVARPVEVRRVQANEHCAASYVVRDTAYRHVELFRVRAQEPLPGTRAPAEGWAYRPGGWRPGDTVTVVVPGVWCGPATVLLTGSAAVVPPQPVHVEVR